MKIPIYDPQINPANVQYNSIADVRTETLGEIADGLQTYGKYREKQLDEERKTEQFKADSAIRYELQDAKSKMIDTIQNGGSYADAEAKYQKIYETTLSKNMPMMGNDPNVTERYKAEYSRVGLGDTIELRNAVQARRKGDVVDATNLRVQQFDDQISRAMIAGDQKTVDKLLLQTSSIYADATAVGAVTRDEATQKIQSKISDTRVKYANYVAQTDPKQAQAILKSYYDKKEVLASDYISAAGPIGKAVEELGTYEQVQSYIADPANNKKPSKESVDVGFNYVIKNAGKMDSNQFENTIIGYSIKSGAVPKQVQQQAGAFLSAEPDTVDPKAAMQMARIVSEISKKDMLLMDGRKFSKDEIATAELMVSRASAGMNETEAVKSVLRQKNNPLVDDIYQKSKTEIISQYAKGKITNSEPEYIDTFARMKTIGASDSEAKSKAEEVVDNLYGKFNGVKIKHPASAIPDPTRSGETYSDSEWNKAVDGMVGKGFIQTKFGKDATPLLMADHETLRLVNEGKQPTFPFAIHLGGDNPDNFIIPRDSDGKPIRIKSGYKLKPRSRIMFDRSGVLG